MLDSLLEQEGPRACAELIHLIEGDGPPLRETSFNIFEVTVDMESVEARVWDVLDGDRDPQVLDIQAFRARLA